MVRPGRDRHTGAGEVDAIYIGGRENSARGRESDPMSRPAAAMKSTNASSNYDISRSEFHASAGRQKTAKAYLPRPLIFGNTSQATMSCAARGVTPSSFAIIPAEAIGLARTKSMRAGSQKMETGRERTSSRS
jgi:hypothetical protein